ncbi:hypothetical protein [Gordonia caeni]|uniref:Uncharacterized protein n=1 Tax=Gordonia caeni TaxID=1007097 RepID=A0ABP7NPY0_9ACTN
MIGGTGVALAEDPPAMEMTPEMILGMLDNEMLTGFVEMCRTGALANGNPDAGQSTAWNPEDTQQGQLPPGAIATCTDSTGHGLALVLPDTFEIGDTAQNMWMDLGPNQSIPIVGTFVMGERNLFNIMGGLLFDAPPVLGFVNVKDYARDNYGVAIDPRMFDTFTTYQDVVDAANLPVELTTRAECQDHTGRITGTPQFLVGCAIRGGSQIPAGTDKNALRRNQALTVAEYLAGPDVSYPRNAGPVQLPVTLPKAKGQSTIKGDGINVALSMRNGRAFAETGNDLAVALAGADKGQLSTAYAKYAIAIAANMDTDDIRFTWFGQEVDFSKLLAAGLLDSEMAAEAGADEMGPMLDMVGGLNGTIPGIKEVFCLGLDAKATAEGLGSCTNFLGTFDTYKDLRPLTNGSQNPVGDSVNRQEQYGLTDISSLIFGNDALLKDFLPMLSGGEGMDMGALLSNPTIVKMLGALTSEEDRIKLTKDFIRYTKNVETTFAKEAVMVDSGETDDDGNPIMVEKKEQVTDADGNLLWEDTAGKRYTQADIDADDDLDVVDLSPVMATVMKNKTTPRMVGAVEDAWETYTDTNDPVMVDDEDENGDPIYLDADGNVVDADTEGAVKKQVQQVDADGNPVFKEKTRHFTRPVMVESTDADGNVITEDFKDADGNVVWVDENGAVVEAGTEGAVKKQTPVLVQKMEQAKDSKGNPLWDPVVERSTTAHWLTSDYGLREPLVIEWLGHQVVFFPAVEVNGTYRPNLMGLPQISRIAQDAQTGLLPKISLVQWDNAFGLGTWTFDKPWDLFGTAKNYADSITLHKDLKQIDDLLGITDGIKDSLGLGKSPAPVDPDVTDPDVTDPGEGEGAEPGDGEGVDQLDSLTTLDEAPESTPSAPSTTPAAPETESSPAPEPELGVTPSAPATPEAPTSDPAPSGPAASDPAPEPAGEPELAGVGAGSSDDAGLSLE